MLVKTDKQEISLYGIVKLMPVVFSVHETVAVAHDFSRVANRPDRLARLGKIISLVNS